MQEHHSPAASAPDEGAVDNLRPRGSNQTGMRQFNERVVLQAIRLHGSLPKADLARLTTLSTQTVALIIARLADDGLVMKLDPLRGKIGQPSVPIALKPDGAFSIGVKIGRRSLDVLLLDFTNTVRMRHSQAYRFPDPRQVFEVIAQQVRAMQAALAPALRGRILGIGVAAPLSLGSWQELMGVADQDGRWNRLDIARQIESDTGLPVMFAKDTAAACVAELVAGKGRSVKSFLYVFVDTFIGGGLVIDSNLYAGLHGNAGAIGSLPVGVAAGVGPGGKMPAQLLSTASLLGLERLYEEAGLDPAAAYDERAGQAPWAEHSARWVAQAAAGIAMVVCSASCMLDPEGVIIDGSCSRALLDQLMAAVAGALDGYDWEGVQRPGVHSGAIGPDARALGGALLPLYANFAPDRELFLKLEA
jgi:predicted NBD/HSP70 family sugar kinase